MTAKNRPSGWLLPDATFHPCEPWQHIAAAKEIEWVKEKRVSHNSLSQCWHLEDDEPMRLCLARLGLAKVCYNIVDADQLTISQLQALQELYVLHDPSLELEFVGGIRMRLELRLFMKLKSPERLNQLSGL